MVTLEGELESPLQELDDSQTQIPEKEKEIRQVRENMKELHKEVEEARAQNSAVGPRKETAEHQLGVAKQKVQFHGSCIPKIEATARK